VNGSAGLHYLVLYHGNHLRVEVLVAR
jgi:hypothetical protein